MGGYEPIFIQPILNMVIQCKNLISLYILPDQRRVRYFDFDQNRLCIC